MNERPFLYVPFSTVAKVLGILLFIVCLKVLAPLLMTLFLAILVAVSLHPVVHWLHRRGLNRGVSITLISLIITASILGIIALVVPKVFQELSSFLGNLPKLKEQILNSLSDTNPLRPLIEHAVQKPTDVAPHDITPLFSAGNIALGGLTEVVLIFVFAIYLLMDGKKIRNWLIAFFSAENQVKINKTTDEIYPLIFSYIAGQFITSILSFFYVLISLSILHVPSALLLATLAGVFDILPVLGFFLSLIPALLFSISISSGTAVIVVLLYILYHLIENYLIIPAVYGSRLRVSGFVVLITLIAAWLLTGIEGAIAALPIVASYPIIERIWLKKVVSQNALSEHQSQVGKK